MDINMLVCSDFHGSEEAADMIDRLARPDDYDIVVMCGDFTTFGSLDFVRKFLKKIKEVKVLAVPGNCDVPQIVGVLDKAHASVHNQRVEFGGWQFFGFGGGIPTNSGMPFEVEEREIERALRSVAAPRGVMVTHTPAYGMNDKGRSGKHGGSRSILRVAEEFKPRLALSGHMHESRGTMTLGETIFLNPGSARNGFYASVWLGEEIKVQLHEETGLEINPKMY